MKKHLKKNRHLFALFAMIALAVAFIGIGAPAGPVLFCLGLWQLSQFAMSKRAGVCYTSALTPEQIKEFGNILDSMKTYGDMFKELKDLGTVEGGFAAIKKLPELLKAEQKRNADLEAELKKVQKGVLLAKQSSNGVRWVGRQPFVTDDCAKALTGVFMLDASRLDNGNALEKLIPDNAKRERILNFSAECIGMDLKSALSAVQKAALDATTTPLPTVYIPQIVELVWHYGQARQYATVYPLGAGVNKLPRLKAGEDDFGYLGTGTTGGLSQAVPEKKVAAELVSFDPNKAGGIIRIPSEIETDTFIQFGQFLARYIARQFAKLEDKTLFLGDGTAAYAGQTGVGPYCTAANGYLQQLAAGKTKPTDATLNDFRAMRAMINQQALLDDPAYYLNPTMEALLVTFNTLNQPLIYRPAMGGTPATLDGFPIRWVGVMQPYSNKAAAGSYLACFGALSYWYLGERGQVRIETSREYYFGTDEIALRALERIDVNNMVVDAMSALQTAAA